MRLFTPSHFLTLLTFLAMPLAAADFPPPDQLPSKPEFPDPLVMLDGTKVTTKEQWESRRKPELKALFQHYMFRYIPDRYKGEFAETEEEATRWVQAVIAGKRPEARRPPELLTRDVVARAIRAEVRAGRGTPHGGVFLDIASRRTPEEIKRKLPGMTTAKGRRLAFAAFINGVHLKDGIDTKRLGSDLGKLCEIVYAER